MAAGGALDPFDPPEDATGAVAAVIASERTAPANRTVLIEVSSDDPGDLTLNQLAALGRCDALVVSGDVAPAILDRARRDASRAASVDTAGDGLIVHLRRS
jgi:uroporphyrin-III C-methyltransferase/precorrin-2 dehydrogenase/sirohydrochlorin ferrochelatase